MEGHWTIELGRQNGRLLHWPKCSCVRTKTKLLEASVASAKFDCPVACQNSSLLATAHACQIGLMSSPCAVPTPNVCLCVFLIVLIPQEFLDKNRDLMRPEILNALKNSDLRFVRELLGKSLHIRNARMPLL